MGTEENDLITRRDAAKLAGVNIRTLDRWRINGLLATYAPSAVRGHAGPSGGCWVRVSRRELLELLDLAELPPGRHSV